MKIDRMLKGHDIFKSLSVEQIHEISNFSSVKVFQAGEYVFKYGGTASHVYMLMKGSVSLRLPAKSEDFSFVISKAEIGELIGLSPLLASRRYTSTALCTETSELLSIEAMPFRKLLQANQQVGFEVMSRVAHIYFNRYIDVLKNLQGVVSQISLIR